MPCTVDGAEHKPPRGGRPARTVGMRVRTGARPGGCGWNIHAAARLPPAVHASVTRLAGARLRRYGVRRRRAPKLTSRSAGGNEILPRFAGLGVTLTIDFRRQSLNRAIDRPIWDAAAPARCPWEQRGRRNAFCQEKACSGMKFANPHIRSRPEKRTVVPLSLLSQATANRRQYKIQCGLNAFEVSKIKGNPQTPESRITL